MERLRVGIAVRVTGTLTQRYRGKNTEGTEKRSGDEAEIEEGSLDYASRRAILRRERKDRVAPLGMTVVNADGGLGMFAGVGRGLLD
jgi:hypothetical protein